MSDVLQLALKFRAALLRREAAAQRAMLDAYKAVWEKLAEEVAKAGGQVAAAGGEATPAQLFVERRLQKLQDQLAVAINSLAAAASRRTQSEQSAVIRLAREHAAALLARAGRGANTARGVAVTFARLPESALTHLVGVAQDGSPVDQLFARIAREMSLESKQVVKRSLVQGVALGWHPNRITAHVRRQVDDTGDNPQRDPKAVRRLNGVMRQQVLGAYREASRLSYEEHKDVLAGWRWTAARGPRTCVICWAMDGTIFPTDTPLQSHPNCRCVMVPVRHGEAARESGAEAFAGLEEGV